MLNFLTTYDKFDFNEIIIIITTTIIQSVLLWILLVFCCFLLLTGANIVIGLWAIKVAHE
jgi:hypothetical protein